MREDGILYERAVARAWRQIGTRLDEIAKTLPGRKLELVAVQYDALPAESVIEELPDRAKSSRPQTVKVSVRLSATYVLR